MVCGKFSQGEQLMIEVNNCVVCDGPIVPLRRALVAPFLAQRIWNKAPFCVEIVECDACGFMFYNPRLEDEELRRLYSNYRSKEYQEMRHASEPWYTKKFNHDLAAVEFYELRRARLAPLLKQYVGDRKIERVLDFGGDRGDLVAGLLEGAEAFVYDISGIPAAEGVTSTNDPVGCRADLIINSNVLEHVGFPRVLVNNILAAAPKGGLLFLEVPCEIMFGFERISRRLAQVGIMAVARPGIARYVLQRASLYMMHEHINYFTERSLSALISACGAKVIASGGYHSSSTAGRAEVAWCLGSNG